jgi:dTMP kinase
MNRTYKQGFFITFEGIEGSGKSTQAKMLADALSASGLEVVLTHEPGGTVIGDCIRDILLSSEHTEMHPTTELLLYAAARSQHLVEKIFPALNRGAIVICDRFSDSTIAYQGFGRNIAKELIDSLDAIATGHFRPRLTFLCDLNVHEGLTRNRIANKSDRLEQESIAFHERVRNGFLFLAKQEPDRFRIIDASRHPQIIAAEIFEHVKQVLCNSA